MTNYPVLIDFCAALARFLHAEDYDKHGKPYFEHCSRVSNGIDKQLLDARCAAFLHDTVEDGKTSLSTLLALNIPSRVVELVEILTRDDGETYADYINRVAKDRDAIAIKLSDLSDNQDPLRGPLPEGLVKRYAKAQTLLLNVLRNWPEEV